MSDPIKHECGIALLRLKQPLKFYAEVCEYFGGGVLVRPQGYGGATSERPASNSDPVQVVLTPY